MVVAVGGTSLICYLLLNRLQNRGARRERVGSDGSGTSPNSSTGGEGWNPFTWFGGDSSSPDSSSASGDTSSGDGRGGGGDGGGGGD